MPEAGAELDKETRAIAGVVNILANLEAAERERVIRYVAGRFEIAIITQPKAALNSTEPRRPGELENRATGEYTEFAALFDACNPRTDSQRALVAAYWLQVCQGSANFDGQAANTLIKHLGHGVSNITRALDPLIQQKPALVLQIRKSGNTRQARKLYMLTEAGVRRVRAMISGAGDDE